MFSTPKKAISKYRDHPILGSPLKTVLEYPLNWLGRLTGSSPTNTSSTTPSPTRSRPIRPFVPADPPLPKAGPSRVTAPFKLGKHRSQIIREKSIKLRRAPGLKRAVDVHQEINLKLVEREVKQRLRNANVEPSKEDMIFLRETRMMGCKQQLEQSLRAARIAAENAVNLEEVSQERRAKLRHERARRERARLCKKEGETLKPKTPSIIWVEDYRAQDPYTGHIKGPSELSDFERLVYNTHKNCEASHKPPQNRFFGRQPFSTPPKPDPNQRAWKFLGELSDRRNSSKLAREQKDREFLAARFRDAQRLEEDRQRREREYKLQEAQRIEEQTREAERVKAERQQRAERLEKERQQQEREAQIREAERQEAERQRREHEARLREAQRLEAERQRQERQAEQLRQREMAAAAAAAEYARRLQEEEDRRREARYAAEAARMKAQQDEEAWREFCRARANAGFSQDTDLGPEPMDVDEAPPSFKPVPPPPAEKSVLQRFLDNEEKWDRLIAGEACSIRFPRLPWPVLADGDVNDPGLLTNENVLQFISHVERPGFESKSLKARVKIDILRWHPDKFTQKHLNKIHVEDRALVMEFVNQVARFLIDLSARL